jgi:dipeptidyl aminopeptidase/acylaminoacyl peptidase
MSPGRIKMFDLSPDGRQLVAVADGSGRLQPWLIPLDGSAARLIELDGVVLRCAWRPDGSRFIAKVDPDGRDDYQLIEVSLADGCQQVIADQPGTRNDIGWPHRARSKPYSPDGRYLAYSSNRRDRTCFDIVLRDLSTGTERIVLEAGDQVPEDRYFPEMFSWDSRQLLVTRLHQQTEQDIYSVDLGTGTARLLTPHEGPAKHFAVAARPEGTYLCATKAGDFTALALLGHGGTMHWIDTPDHDIDFAVLSADGGTLAWSVNQNGYSTIKHCLIVDGQPQKVQQVTCLPPDAYVFETGIAGHVLQFADDGRTLLALDGGGAIWSVDLDQDEATRFGAEHARIRPETVAFTSTDGTTVPAYLYKPDGPAPFPVVIDIHGGPEIQAMPVPEPLHEKLLARGIAVLVPNIRGSAGYGLRYQRLIYRDWGRGDVEDLRAAAEFLRAQPWADQDRLAVFGASYGGFAALCCLTMLPEYWRAGVSECGVSDQVQDIRTMPPMWRRRAKDWVGDVDDPEDLRRLIQASPITHVDRVRVPVLLLHGTNDTNVDIASSDTFYARLTELGRPVDYERITGAGHSISRQVDVPTLVCDWLADQLKNVISQLSGNLLDYPSCP